MTDKQNKELVEACLLTDKEKAWLAGWLPNHLQDIPKFIDGKIAKSIPIIRKAERERILNILKSELPQMPRWYRREDGKIVLGLEILEDTWQAYWKDKGVEG